MKFHNQYFPYPSFPNSNFMTEYAKVPVSDMELKLLRLRHHGFPNVSLEYQLREVSKRETASQN